MSDAWWYALWPDPGSTSRSRALERRKVDHFHGLSPPPFIMTAGKWPRILKLGHNLPKAYRGRIFDFCSSFLCHMTLKLAVSRSRLDCQCRTGLIYVIGIFCRKCLLHTGPWSCISSSSILQPGHLVLQFPVLHSGSDIRSCMFYFCIFHTAICKKTMFHKNTYFCATIFLWWNKGFQKVQKLWEGFEVVRVSSWSKQ